MNRPRKIVALAVALLLALVLTAAAAASPALPAGRPGEMSGGGYHLTPRIAAPAASGFAAGGVYRLRMTGPAASSDNGCCCLFLPCTVR